MKKLIALLLVLVMALSVVACTPSSSSGGTNTGNNSGNNSGENQTPELKVPSGPNDDLVLDANGMGYCGVCGGNPVEWEPLTGSVGELKDVGHKHYYLAEDNIVSFSVDQYGYFLWARANASVCLHLNNKTIDVHGALRSGNGNVLNVMGKGTMNFKATSTNDIANRSLFLMESATLTIYGGTYTCVEDTETIGTSEQGTPTISLKGDATFSNVSCTLGALTVDGDVKIDKLVVGPSTNPSKQGSAGKVWITKNFAGEVKSFSFPGAMVDNKVPATYAAAMGAFTGKITTADGVALAGSQGALVAATQAAQ